MDLAPVITRVRTVERRVAVELQWDLDGDDDDDCEWFLGLYVVVERPGEIHARYDCIALGVKFPTETREQREDAVASAGAVAAEADLPVRVPDVTDRGGHRGSNWIRDQVTTRATFAVSCEVRWWSDDGMAMDASGVDTVEASSGDDAEMLVTRQLLERFAQRPMTVNAWWRTKQLGWTHGLAYPDAFPDMLTVRRRALDLDARPSAIARMLVARVPTATALQLMVVFEDSFYCWFGRLDPLARWKRGDIDDDALDAALSLRDSQDDWSRAVRLQDAFAAGRSIAAMMRAEYRTAPNSLHAMRSLREAFPIGFGAANVFVDDCRDAGRDRELDDQIRALFPDR